MHPALCEAHCHSQSSLGQWWIAPEFLHFSLATRRGVQLDTRKRLQARHFMMLKPQWRWGVALVFDFAKLTCHSKAKPMNQKSCTLQPPSISHCPAPCPHRRLLKKHWATKLFPMIFTASGKSRTGCSRFAWRLFGAYLIRNSGRRIEATIWNFTSTQAWCKAKSLLGSNN